MARLKDENLILNVIVNGNQGKQELGNLSRYIKDTTREVSKLEQQEAKLRAEGKRNTVQYEEVTRAIRQKNEAIEQARTKMVKLVQEMDITGMSMDELKANAIALKRAMDNSVPGSERWNILNNQLEAVRGRITEVDDQARRSGSSLSNLANGFNRFIGVITAGIASFLAAIAGMRAAVNAFAELDDQMGSVQKTTGLTKDEVVQLNDQLKNIETRTSQEDLLGLGRIGGKLGIAKDDLEGFVKATDQITVALNEDLGGNVEETVNKVGKLVDIFNVKQDFGIEKSLLKVGSTINDLGASSTANEEYLVDFTNRVAGVAPSARISIQNVLGLAATLDQFGQSAEVAATAYSNTIPDMFRNTGTYAKVAGMNVKDFTDLLNKDANEAFIKVLEGIKGNNSGLTEMVKRLDDLGVDGARSVSVLSTLANNTETLRNQQILANKSFEQGTSITNEYNTMNSTAKAKLEESQKQLHLYVVELGERLYPVMSGTNSLITMFVRLLTVMVGFLTDHWRILATLTAAVTAYNATVFLQNALSKEGIIVRTAEIALAKLKVFWDTAMTASMHLLSAAYALATGNIAAAKAEMILFNTVTKLNPLAALLGILAAVTVAWIAYTDRITAAVKVQKLLAETEADAQKSIVDQKLKMEELIRTARNKKLSDDERIAAIKQLNDLSPEYLGNLKLETINTDETTRATEKYIDSLLKAARVKAAQDKVAELEKKRIDIVTKGEGGEISFGQRVLSLALTGLGYVDKAAQVTANGIADSYKEAMSDLDKQQAALEKYINSNSPQQRTKTSTNPTGGGDYVSEKDQKEQAKKEREARLERERERKAEIEAENAAYQQRLKDAGLFNRSRTTMTSDELEQLAALEQDHQDKIRAINDKGNKTTIEQTNTALTEIQRRQQAELAYREKLINKLDDDIEQENQANEQRLKKAGLYNVKMEDLQAQLLKATEAGNQKEVDALKEKIRALEILEGIHQANMNTIDAKKMKEGIEKKQQAYEEELADLKIRNNLELADLKSVEDAKAILQDTLTPAALDRIRTLAEAKKALQKKYDDEESQLTRQHMEDLLRQLQDTVQSGQFDGLNLGDKILSDDEKKELEKKILELKQQLASLKNGGIDNLNDQAANSDLDKLDILGFSGSDWDQLFKNLENGKVGVQDILQVAQGLAAAWGTYNQFVEAGEKKQLQQFQASTNKKKQVLQKQLDDGKISQEDYNKQVQKLDADLDQKQAEFDYNSAKRQRNVSLMGAIVNTAQAVTKALPNIPLSILVGALGAIQIGTILKTPLPEVPGKDIGGPFDDSDPDNRPGAGYMTVKRSQDGHTFRAKSDPSKRGFVSQPTVLVGESGREFVVNNDGVSNPTIAPVLSMIDTAQRNGTISTLNLERILYDRQSTIRVSGRASGGSLSDTKQPTATSVVNSTDPALMEILKQIREATNKLNKRLEDPIPAEVVLLGKNGFIQKMDELTDLQSQNNL